MLCSSKCALPVQPPRIDVSKVRLPETVASLMKKLDSSLRTRSWSGADTSKDWNPFVVDALLINAVSLVQFVAFWKASCRLLAKMIKEEKKRKEGRRKKRSSSGSLCCSNNSRQFVLLQGLKTRTPVLGCQILCVHRTFFQGNYPKLMPRMFGRCCCDFSVFCLHKCSSCLKLCLEGWEPYF